MCIRDSCLGLQVLSTLFAAVAAEVLHQQDAAGQHVLSLSSLTATLAAACASEAHNLDTLLGHGVLQLEGIAANGPSVCDSASVAVLQAVLLLVLTHLALHGLLSAPGHARISEVVAALQQTSDGLSGHRCNNQLYTDATTSCGAAAGIAALVQVLVARILVSIVVLFLLLQSLKQ